MNVQSQVITQAHLDKGMDYEAYRMLIDELLTKDQTTGDNHSESMLEYTRLNVQRMNKWDKIFKPSEELIEKVKTIYSLQHWMVLTEAWCGDAAQNLPAIAKIAAINDNIKLSLLLRDENLDVMDAYLTNGGRSIPKFVILDHNLNELGQWGPRPQPVQEILMNMKATGEFSYDEFNIQAHTWYAKDRMKTLQRELLTLIQA